MSSESSDCCGTCEFNTIQRAAGQRPSAYEDYPFFCEIRRLVIENPFWTYCYNHQRRNPLLVRRIRGPLWAAVSPALRQISWDAGAYIPPQVRPPRDALKHARVPYYDGVRPLDSDAGRCEVCGEEAEHTIALRVSGADRRCFCSVAHYLQWWLKTAPGAEPYRNLRPVPWDTLENDLVVLSEALADLDAQPITTLDEKRVLDVLGGLEGALIQAGHGYIDLVQAEIYLRRPEARGELSPHLLRILLAMAEVGQLMREEPRNRQAIRNAVHRIRESLDSFLAGQPGEEERPAKKWWQFWK